MTVILPPWAWPRLAPRRARQVPRPSPLPAWTLPPWPSRARPVPQPCPALDAYLGHPPPVTVSLPSEAVITVALPEPAVVSIRLPARAWWSPR